MNGDCDTVSKRGEGEFLDKHELNPIQQGETDFDVALPAVSSVLTSFRQLHMDGPLVKLWSKIKTTRCVSWNWQGEVFLYLSLLTLKR